MDFLVTEHKRIAIVVDWLIDFGGAELVISHLLELYPEADIYTSVCYMDHPMLAGRRVYTSWIQKVAFFNRRHKLAGILRPWAFRSFDLSGYDLIICSSSAESKQVAMGRWRHKKDEKQRNGGSGVETVGGSGKTENGGAERASLSTTETFDTFGHKSIDKKNVIIVYCHTPIRYYWSHYEEYRNMMEFGIFNPLARAILGLLIGWLRRLDYEAAQHVDYFIANSRTTQERIQKYYHRESVVIYPGIEIQSLENSRKSLDRNSENSGLQLKNYYISVGRCIPYKKFDLLVDTFNHNGKRIILCTATDTPLYRELREKSKPNIEWRFRVSNEEKNTLIAGARAFLFPPLEDLGLVPIEAMSLGTPIIAYGVGGATETVIDGETGIFFSQQSPESLSEAIVRFEDMALDQQKIRTHAEQFSKERFQEKMENFIQQLGNNG